MSVFSSIKSFFNEEETAIECVTGEIHAVVTNLGRRVAALETSAKARAELVGAAVSLPSGNVEAIVQQAIQAQQQGQGQLPQA